MDADQRVRDDARLDVLRSSARLLGEKRCKRDGVPLEDVLLARELPRLALSAAMRRTASAAMILGNVLLPPALFAAAACRPCKYLLPVPATAVFAALVLTAWGVWGAKDD